MTIGCAVLAKTDSEKVFQANRASGDIALAVARAGDGRTRRTRVHEDGSLRVRFPNTTDDALEAVIVNTGGGMTGGDRFAIEMSVGPGAALVAGTTAAEKIYRTTGPDAEMRVKLSVGEGARLVWLPQETILFDGARLSRHIDIDLAARASLVMAEAVLFGRAAMGETIREGLFADRWRLHREGQLIFAENVRLGGSIAGKLASPAVAAAGVAVATVLVSPCGDDKIAAVRALQWTAEVGISAWNGIAVARLVAADGAALRRDLIALLSALGTNVPRLWLQ
jgi:urease accessory protein